MPWEDQEQGPSVLEMRGALALHYGADTSGWPASEVLRVWRNVMWQEPTADVKDTNPKDLIGSDKLPLSQLPVMGKAYQALAHLEGTLKYGLVNWREAGVRASIYLDAMERHMGKLKDGEWADPKTKVPHLGSIMACCAILADAYECGKLVDDRPKPVPGIGEKLDALTETVRHLKAFFAEEHPTHYTRVQAGLDTP